MIGSMLGRRLVGAVEQVEAEAGLDVGVAPEFRGRRDAVIDGNRVLAAVGGEEKVAERHQRQVGVGLR